MTYVTMILEMGIGHSKHLAPYGLPEAWPMAGNIRAPWFAHLLVRHSQSARSSLIPTSTGLHSGLCYFSSNWTWEINSQGELANVTMAWSIMLPSLTRTAAEGGVCHPPPPPRKCVIFGMLFGCCFLSVLMKNKNLTRELAVYGRFWC